MEYRKRFDIRNKGKSIRGIIIFGTNGNNKKKADPDKEHINKSMERNDKKYYIIRSEWSKDFILTCKQDKKSTGTPGIDGSLVRQK